VLLLKLSNPGAMKFQSSYWLNSLAYDFGPRSCGILRCSDKTLESIILCTRKRGKACGREF
jgi:hypothetical protein